MTRSRSKAGALRVPDNGQAGLRFRNSNHYQVYRIHLVDSSPPLVWVCTQSFIKTRSVILTLSDLRLILNPLKDYCVMGLWLTVQAQITEIGP